MLEKLLLALVIIEFVGVIHNISESVMNVISTRHLVKAQVDALEGQQKAIKLQEEQYKLNKDYSEKQNEYNKSLEHLAYLISSLEARISVLEREKKPKPKKTTKKEGETK